MTSRLGKSIFVSYRGRYFNVAKSLVVWLRSQRLCNDVVLFPPNTLCAPNEVLMPYEYVEIMGNMRDAISACDAFVFLNTQDYFYSYFTQTELLQWRIYRTPPTVYPVQGDSTARFIIGQPFNLGELTKNNKRLWANIVVGIDRRHRGKFNPGFSGGKYNRNTYLTYCCNCGEHFLVGKKLMAVVLKEKRRILCPHCGCDTMGFTEETHVGHFYRRPIILQWHSQRPCRSPRVLEEDEIIQLLIKNELPERIRLVALEGEGFDSDLKKLGKFYLAAGAVALGAFLLASLFSKDKDS